MGATLVALVLELSAGAGPRLRALLLAPGRKLELISGVGRAGEDGLALRPRPGRPCRVRIGAIR